MKGEMPHDEYPSEQTEIYPDQDIISSKTESVDTNSSERNDASEDLPDKDQIIFDEHSIAVFNKISEIIAGGEDIESRVREESLDLAKDANTYEREDIYEKVRSLLAQAVRKEMFDLSEQLGDLSESEEKRAVYARRIAEIDDKYNVWLEGLYKDMRLGQEHGGVMSLDSQPDYMNDFSAEEGESSENVRKLHDGLGEVDNVIFDTSNADDIISSLERLLATNQSGLDNVIDAQMSRWRGILNKATDKAFDEFFLPQEKDGVARQELEGKREQIKGLINQIVGRREVPVQPAMEQAEESIDSEANSEEAFQKLSEVMADMENSLADADEDDILKQLDALHEQVGPQLSMIEEGKLDEKREQLSVMVERAFGKLIDIAGAGADQDELDLLEVKRDLARTLVNKLRRD